MTTFTELGLAPALLKALASEGYETPTPIQAKAIPHVLDGRDLLGIAQTGTGKTAAFALPILHQLANNRKHPMRQGARVLILAPTRELATQIGQSFKTYGRHMKLRVATIFGGVGHGPQIAAMRDGVDVLIATPGRLIDHLEAGKIALGGTEILVLDEADQMLDMGFIRPIRTILSRLSARRQNLFFSATMSKETQALADDILRDPAQVSVAPRAKTVDSVAQSVIHIDAPRKRALLAELFADPSMSRAIVFTRTKRGADKVARYLDDHAIKVSAIHGNKSQNQRDAALKAFKAGRIRALVATDIAARGIDIDEVSHVINYELPNLPESYVHRIGRTARAGMEGIAISFCAKDEQSYLRDIERLIRQSIPSENRTGDTDLVVEERPVTAQPRERGPKANGRSNGHGQARGKPHRDNRRKLEDRGEAASAGRGASAAPVNARESQPSEPSSQRRSKKRAGKPQGGNSPAELCQSRNGNAPRQKRPRSGGQNNPSPVVFGARSGKGKDRSTGQSAR